MSNKTSPRRQFWEMLKGNKLTLITQEESKDADVQHLTKNDALKVKFFLYIYHKPFFLILDE